MSFLKWRPKAVAEDWELQLKEPASSNQMAPVLLLCKAVKSTASALLMPLCMHCAGG